MPGPKPWKALLDRFERAGFGLRNVHTVVVTHSHIDHFGASGRVREKTGARVVTSRSFRTWWDPTDVGERELEALDGDTEVGVTPDPRRPWQQPTPWGGKHRGRLGGFDRYRVMKPLMKQWFATPSPSVRLADAEPSASAAQQGRGAHAGPHAGAPRSLRPRRRRIAVRRPRPADHHPAHLRHRRRPDPLSAFFSSLEKVGELDGVTTVLPAHGHPFDDLRERVKDIERHHEERLARLREATGELGEATVEKLSHRLFRERSWGPMAESETYADLEHLRLSGRATRAEPTARSSTRRPDSDRPRRRHTPARRNNRLT